VPLSGLLTLLVYSIFCHRVLADYGLPIAAARPLICHGPLYTASSCCCQVQSEVMGPCTASHCCCLHRPHSAMCHFQVSSHMLVVSIFVIGCCMASHCCCLHRHTVAPHSGFGPVTGPK
ncbi:unnamed protein product, partial [Staurois parvus]